MAEVTLPLQREHRFPGAGAGAERCLAAGKILLPLQREAYSRGLRPLPPTPKKGHDIGKQQGGITAGMEERPRLQRILAGERATKGPSQLWQLWNRTGKHMYSEQRKTQRRRRRTTEQERKRDPHRKLTKINGSKR